MKTLLRITWAALAVLTVAACSERPIDPVIVEHARMEAWPDDVVEAFGRIPVQERGRIKPLSTVAGFRMLNTNGKRKFVLAQGTELPTVKDEAETLDPVRWYLDAMLFPEQARNYEIFLVNDSDALEAIGLRFENRKRRDRYSYNQLLPARERLEEQAQAARMTEARDRSRIESQLYDLSNNINQYEILESTLSTLVTELGEAPSERMRKLFPEGASGRPFSVGTAISRWDTLLEWSAESVDEGAQSAFVEELEPLEAGLTAAIRRKRFALALIPPSDTSEEQWRSAGDVLEFAVTPTGPGAGASELDLINSLANIWVQRDSVATAGPAIIGAARDAEAAAEARSEFTKIPMEISYYEHDFFTRALVFFLLGFLAIAFSWLAPTRKWLPLVTWGTTIIGVTLVIWGVTIRCLLLERPPVATLYETILFITSIIVVVCLIAERLTKERVALAMAAALGLAGMFLAGKYELLEAGTQGDTMGGLVAVLNTNFWLATHVTSVTMGYAAGLLTAALAHVWIVMRLYRAVVNRGPDLSPEQRDWFRRFGRMVYGVLCFGLLFSVVGTILGGVWANDSWGRFWGWDPKENGALMIVLYELVIVHARLGGYIRDFGVALLSVVGGMIVAFSWWHVNHLGVGLHSYGFTEGIIHTLYKYYGLALIFVALSLIGWAIYLRPRRTLGSA